VSVVKVTSLDAFRGRTRLRRYRAKLERIIAGNRRDLDALHATGELFSFEGARTGQNLLLAHQLLLRVAAMLDQLADEGPVPAPRSAKGIEALYRELDNLLERSVALAGRGRVSR
jgi:hypothetical protein